MSIPSFIERQTERRSHSIYSRFQPPHDSRSWDELFRNSELPLSLKFSAVLAAYARFKFPLQLSAFRSLIPDPVWNEYFRFRYISMRTGCWPIFAKENEWDLYEKFGFRRISDSPHLMAWSLVSPKSQ